VKFTTEHIVQYLAGSFSKEATQLFDQELLTNTELKAELEIQKLTNSLIGINEESNILSTIKTAQNNYQRKNLLKKAGIAALLLIASTSVLWFLNQEAKTPKEENTLFKKEVTHPVNHEALVEKSNIKDTVSPKTTIELKKEVKQKIEIEKREIATSSITDVSEIKKIKTTPIKEVKQAVTVKNTTELIASQKELEVNPKVILSNPCDLVIMETQLSIEHVCPQLSLGAIDIISSEGGLSPYTYELKTSNISIKDWSELETGNYIFLTKDANNCTSEKSFTIIDKDCPLNYDFNPSLNQQWVALKAFDNGKITITHAKSGEQISQSKLIKGESITWDGLKNNGDYSLGFHIFVIEYENNKIVKGKITVSQ
jgi:hypothetical protein